MEPRSVLDRIHRAEDLPTIPHVVAKLLDLCRDSEASAEDLASVIGQDASLSTRVLKVVNSAFYGRRDPVGSLQQAVVVLGSRAIQSVVLSTSVVKMFSGSSSGSFDYLTFWEDSLRRGVTAKLLSDAAPSDRLPDAMLCGLIMDIGTMGLAHCFPAKYAEVTKRLGEGQVDPREFERMVFDIDHCEVGEDMARSWRFPDVMCQVIRHHHEPESPEVPAEHRAMVRLGALAFDIAAIYRSVHQIDQMDDIRQRASEQCKLDTDAFDTLLANISTEVTAAAQFFGLDVAEQRSFVDIIVEANRELGKLNLSYDQVVRQLQEALSREGGLRKAIEDVNVKLEDANERLLEQANTDALTGLYNRRFFHEFYGRQLAHTARYRDHLSVLMLDVDHFKRFNDTYGHEVGDLALKHLAGLLNQQVRASDLVARYGGEEFVFLLPHTPAQGGKIFAERVRRTVQSSPVTLSTGRQIPMTVSVGGCTLPFPDGELEDEDALRVADAALYQSKNNGRNKVTWAE